MQNTDTQVTLLGIVTPAPAVNRIKFWW